MLHQWLTPDVVSWSVGISACGMGNQQKLQGAFGLLQEMVHQLLRWNVVSWSATISACEKCKQWERASGLLQEVVHQLPTVNYVS